MSTFELMIWCVLWLLISVEVAGIGFLIFSGQASCPESEALLAHADEAQRAEAARG